MASSKGAELPQRHIQIMTVGAGLDGGGVPAGVFVGADVVIDGAQPGRGLGPAEALGEALRAGDDGAGLMTEAQRADADEARMQADGRDKAEVGHDRTFVLVVSAANSRRWRAMTRLRRSAATACL